MSGEQGVLTVPVFPLNTALFPRIPLPLHIFEERYREMVADLSLGDNRFCVALIREGVEVGGPADPYPVACLAEIARSQRLADGRYHLIAVGVERVRILSLDSASKPYLLGQVELWPDEAGSVSPPLVEQASRLFNEYVGYLMALSGEKSGDYTLPVEPDALSYVLAAALQIDAHEKQHLLELPDSEHRLQAEVSILQAAMPLLHALVRSPKPPTMGDGKFSAN